MRETVWLAANTLTYPEGGGHLWAYLNWALGLRQAGCNVVWLEHVDPAFPEAEMQRLTVLLKQKLARYGLADAMALCARDGSELSPNATANLIPLDAAGEADLFLNMAYNNLSSSVLARFRRTLLLDIDPGLLQVWISEGVVSIPQHDLYFTIGETVGKTDSLFPSGAYEWIYTAPCVALEHWPVLPVRDDAPFTTITHWGAQEWLTYGDESYANDKRTGFLPFLELPRHTSVPIELALCQAADEQLRLLPYEEDERQRLLALGWRVVHSHGVSKTPWDYQSYIQQSRGEFSCAKPSAVRLQSGWISDRTICYLASGRPAIVQWTGPSRYPRADGLFRFKDMDEALRALEAVTSNYDHHARQARHLAEEYFSAEKVVPRLLDRALDRKRV